MEPSSRSSVWWSSSPWSYGCCRRSGYWDRSGYIAREPTRASSDGHGGRSQPAFHNLMIDDSGLLMNELTGREDSKVGDSAYRIPRSQLLIAVGVHLEHDSLT